MSDGHVLQLQLILRLDGYPVDLAVGESIVLDVGDVDGGPFTVVPLPRTTSLWVALALLSTGACEFYRRGARRRLPLGPDSVA